MEVATLKKKLSTYLSEGGYLKNVPEDLLCQVLHCWEEWIGSSKEFYSTIGFTQYQMASLIGKAKRLKREGYFGNESFKELKPPESVDTGTDHHRCQLIELQTQKGQIIRFPQLSLLLEYLEKVG